MQFFNTVFKNPDIIIIVIIIIVIAIMIMIIIIIVLITIIISYSAFSHWSNSALQKFMKNLKIILTINR